MKDKTYVTYLDDTVNKYYRVHFEGQNRSETDNRRDEMYICVKTGLHTVQSKHIRSTVHIQYTQKSIRT